MSPHPTHYNQLMVKTAFLVSKACGFVESNDIVTIQKLFVIKDMNTRYLLRIAKL
jgi:hypothetical protein